MGLRMLLPSRGRPLIGGDDDIGWIQIEMTQRVCDFQIRQQRERVLGADAQVIQFPSDWEPASAGS